MTKFKRWLVDRYLPAYARDALEEETETLQQQVETLSAENARLRAYIDGMQMAMRAQRRMVVQTGGKR